MDYVSTLMAIAVDESRPQSAYALSILENFAQILIADRDIKSLSVFMDKIPPTENPADQKVAKWISNLLWIKDLIQNPRSLDTSEADKAASIITNEPRYFQRQKINQYDLLEYSNPTIVLKDYLYINPKTGFWRLSKFKKLENTQLEELAAI